MKTITSRTYCSPRVVRCTSAITCAALLLAGIPLVRARDTPQQPAAAQEVVKVPAGQLDALVAPIALYPDPLLSQTLVASTYPLEIIQLQQWLVKGKFLNDKALAEAVAKQPWDPSIQAMAVLPSVVKRLADDIQWTTDLGNAFLAQQGDVMEAVQRMRAKAQDKGALKSNEQQKVETQMVESKQVIVIQQSNPEVIYVPSYSPAYVYGPLPYPYPPIYYPPYSTGAVVAATAISFGVGVAIGAAWGGGGWGWGCGWGNNNINVNMNNNFNRNTNISGGNRTNVGGGNTWQHNPQHRGGAPYSDRATANKFGGAARGDSMANRQRGAQQQLGRQGGNVSSGAGNRAGVGDRGGVGNQGGAGNRGGVGNQGGAGNRGGGGDRVGNRSVGSGSGSRDAFGGGSGGFNGASTRSNSSRGSSSMGGGFGGGSRGGGGRGGGGGRRGR